MATNNKLAVGAVIGAAVGIVAGILTAPKSGKETRDDISRKANDVKDKAALQRDDAVFKVEEIADELRLKANEVIDKYASKHDKSNDK